MPFGRAQPGQAALREKMYAAERRMAVIRIAIIALNTVTYLAFFDRTLGSGWLALTVIGVAWACALPLALFEPYRRMAFLMASLFTAGSDGILISLWLVATGGYDSPFYLLVRLNRQHRLPLRLSPHNDLGRPGFGGLCRDSGCAGSA